MMLPPQPIKPEEIDAAAVRRQIAEVKQALVEYQPDRKAYVESHPTWPLIEAMALDPAYSARERSVLLANPLHLSRSDLDFRKRLVREYRNQPNVPPPKDRIRAGSIKLHVHAPPLNPTESLELSG